MSKIAVVYWSGTGNTEAMADLVANAAQSAGATVDKMTSAERGFVHIVIQVGTVQRINQRQIAADQPSFGNGFIDIDDQVCKLH